VAWERVVGVFGLVLMILFWVGLIALAIWLARGPFPPVVQPPAPPAGQDLNAREILDWRFARGEINGEEYDLMRETITDRVA
jgi:uncharacterized membrane protein